MFRTRGSYSTLLPAVFLSFLFLFAAGASGEIAAQDPPEKAAAEQELVHAEEALTVAMAEAEKNGQLVFLHTGADW